MEKEISSIKKQFPKFKVIDKDKDFLYMRDGEIGKSNVIEARINRGSLGDYNVRFVVEKHGCRSRIIGGNNKENSIKRVKSYLKDSKC